MARRLVGVGLMLLVCVGVAGAESRLDLNQASVEELMALPGIGEAKARAIVDHRAAVPFERPEELLEVKGIGRALFSRLEAQVRVGSGTGDREGAAADDS